MLIVLNVNEFPGLAFSTSAFFIPATVTTTRGHNYKLFKSHTRCHSLTRTNFFSNRVIEDWNHLPNDVVNAETLNTFS